MWRFVSRHSKEYWKSVHSSKCRAEQLRRICCFPEAGQCNGKKENSEEKRGKKSTWDANTQVQPHNWIGALGWSGILVVGWYLSQPSRLRSLLGCSSPPAEGRYQSTVAVLLHSVSAQPLNRIVPQAALESGPELLESGQDLLDQAAESFAQVHGSVENRLGVALARRKCHYQAVEMFRKAANRGHPAAAFNLGLCHEMGLGTTQDFCKAGECYETAADGGHATATYNLGVFYVHGWGGKMADCARAKQLFVTAAQLGQLDAQQALGMVQQRNTQDKSCKHDPVTKLVGDATHKYTAMLET